MARADARVASPRAARRRDARHRPAEQPAARQRRPARRPTRASARCAAPARRSRRRSAQIAATTGCPSPPGGSVPARDLGEDRRAPLRPRQPRVEQPLADAATAPARRARPAARRSISSSQAPTRDAEPPAQERPHGMLDEAHEVVELDDPRVERRQRRRAGTGRGSTRSAVERARAVERRRGRSSRRAPGSARRREVARVERLQRVAGPATAPASPPASVRPTTSSSSPTGTAGGRGRFVRSSLPV